MLYMVTFTIFYHQYTPNVSIYTIRGSYGYIYIYTHMGLSENRGPLILMLDHHDDFPIQKKPWFVASHFSTTPVELLGIGGI